MFCLQLGQKILIVEILIYIFFTIKDTKLYVPVATLSARDNQKLSKFLRKGFERPVYMNKCKIKRHNKNTTNGFRYFIESDFVGANTLFV